MKKFIFTLLLAVASVLAVTAQSSKVLFEDADAPMLNWNVLCTVSAADVDGIKAGDIIEATVAEVKAGVDWPKFGFEGVSDKIYPAAFEMWGDKTFPYTAKYIVTEDDLKTLSDGFDIKGDGVRVTKIEYIKTQSVELPEGQSMLFNNPDAPMLLEWSVLCTVTAAQVEGIKAGDSFVVTVNARDESEEWPKFGFEGVSDKIYPAAFEMWGDKTFPYEATYYVTADDVALLKDGFDIKGNGIQITRVVFVSQSGEADAEIVLWKGEPTAVIWGAGPTVEAGKAETIKAGDKLAITVTDIVRGEGKWPKVVCRSEDGWAEVFTIELYGDDYVDVELPLVIEETVTEAMLPLLQPGFNFGGESASINKVALIKKSDSSGVEGIITVETPSVVSVYSINGICVRHNVEAASATTGLPAGLYIVGGKKVLVK